MFFILFSYGILIRKLTGENDFNVVFTNICLMLNHIYKFQKGVNCSALFVRFKSSFRMLLLLLIFSGLKHLVVKFRRLIHSFIMPISIFAKKGGGGFDTCDIFADY